MNHLDLCSGAGGFSLAARLAGLEIEQSYFADINEYANTIFKKHFPSAVALGDVRNVQREDFAGGGKWLVTAGFPCQPFSVAGSGKGIDDDRYLWHEILRIAVEFRADWFIFENVTGIESVPFSTRQTRLEMRRNQRTEGFDDFEAIYARQEELQLAKCCQDLEDAGASFQVFDIPAISVNAWHRRRRIWIVGSFANSYDGQLKPQNKIRTGRKSVVNGCQRNDSDDHEQRQFQSQGIVGHVGRRTRNGYSGNIADDSGKRFKKRGQSRCGKLQAQKGTRFYYRPEFTNCQFGRNSADNQSERSEKPRLQKSFRFGKTSRSDAYSQWKRHWVEVAAELCRSDDGLRTELDIARLRHDLERSYPSLTEADFELALGKLESEYRRKRIELMGNSIIPQIVEIFMRIIKEIKTNF